MASNAAMRRKSAVSRPRVNRSVLWARSGARVTPTRRVTSTAGQQAGQPAGSAPAARGKIYASSDSYGK
jgi:hypothetical protein